MDDDSSNNNMISGEKKRGKDNKGRRFSKRTNELDILQQLNDASELLYLQLPENVKAILDKLKLLQRNEKSYVFDQKLENGEWQNQFITLEAALLSILILAPPLLLVNPPNFSRPASILQNDDNINNTKEEQDDDNQHLNPNTTTDISNSMDEYSNKGTNNNGRSRYGGGSQYAKRQSHSSSRTSNSSFVSAQSINPTKSSSLIKLIDASSLLTNTIRTLLSKHSQTLISAFDDSATLDAYNELNVKVNEESDHVLKQIRIITAQGKMVYEELVSHTSLLVESLTSFVNFVLLHLPIIYEEPIELNINNIEEQSPSSSLIEVRKKVMNSLSSLKRRSTIPIKSVFTTSDRSSYHYENGEENSRNYKGGDRNARKDNQKYVRNSRSNSTATSISEFGQSSFPPVHSFSNNIPKSGGFRSRAGSIGSNKSNATSNFSISSAVTMPAALYSTTTARSKKLVFTGNNHSQNILLHRYHNLHHHNPIPNQPISPLSGSYELFSTNTSINNDRNNHLHNASTLPPPLTLVTTNLLNIHEDEPSLLSPSLSNNVNGHLKHQNSSKFKEHFLEDTNLPRMPVNLLSGIIEKDVNALNNLLQVIVLYHQIQNTSNYANNTNNNSSPRPRRSSHSNIKSYFMKHIYSSGISPSSNNSSSKTLKTSKYDSLNYWPVTENPMVFDSPSSPSIPNFNINNSSGNGNNNSSSSNKFSGRSLFKGSVLNGVISGISGNNNTGGNSNHNGGKNAKTKRSKLNKMNNEPSKPLPESLKTKEIYELSQDGLVIELVDGSPRVLAGTLEKMLLRLADEYEQDNEFIDCFVLSHVFFITSEDFLESMIARFITENKNPLIQKKVLIVFERWVAIQPQDFLIDYKLYERLMNFLKDNVMKTITTTSITSTTTTTNNISCGFHEEIEYIQSALEMEKSRQVQRNLFSKRYSNLSMSSSFNPQSSSLMLQQQQQQQQSEPSSSLSSSLLSTSSLSTSSSLTSSTSTTTIPSSPLTKKSSNCSIPIPLQIPTLNDSSPLLEFEPKSIAKYLTLMDYCALKSITFFDFITIWWKKRQTFESGGSSSNSCTSDNSSVDNNGGVNLKTYESQLDAFTRRSNMYCREWSNFHTAMFIALALNSRPVRRLEKTWESLSNQDILNLQNIEELIDTSGNMKNYRKALTNANNNRSPVVPFFATFLKDLTFIMEGNPTYLPLGHQREVKLRNPSNLSTPTKEHQSETQELKLSSSNASLNTVSSSTTTQLINFEKFRLLVKNVYKIINSTLEIYSFSNQLSHHIGEVIERRMYAVAGSIFSAIPPCMTYFRVINQSSIDKIQKIIQDIVDEQCKKKNWSNMKIKKHSILPDVLCVPVRGPFDNIKPFKKEVIVDVHTGVSILRGADVFAPGVLAAQNVEANEDVAIMVDLDGKCLRGYLKNFTGRKLFVGNGKMILSRDQIFQTDPSLVSGIGVLMTQPIYCTPSLSNLKSLIFLQNLPSILTGHLLNLKPNQRVLDMCASPGGKTTHIANLFSNNYGNNDNQKEEQRDALIIAIDRSEKKLEKIRKNCKDCKVKENLVKCFCLDGTKAVLCQQKDIDEFSFEKLLMMELIDTQPAYQKKLFESAFSLLKPGGTLIYSTCTINPSENEKIVSWALQTFKGNLILLEPEIKLGKPGLLNAGLSDEQRMMVQRFDPSTSMKMNEEDDCNDIGGKTIVAKPCADHLILQFLSTKKIYPLDILFISNASNND
nr:14804_t:CDS:10 [Entrophospora candida]